ncbi:MAG: hypothetical protein HC945_03660 [Nitrosarchaeum sp.]|nr:hypothetical protein [Nitrosarchaeum sp.]
MSEEQTKPIDTTSLDEPVAEPARLDRARTKRATAKKTAAKRTPGKPARQPTNAPSPRQKQRKEESGLIYWIAPLAVLIVIVILASIFLDKTPSTTTSEDSILVTVNGEDIKESDLSTQYALLPDQITETITEEEILSQMVEELILLQEAERRDIVATEDDIDQAMLSLLERNNLGLKQLEENVIQRGLTIADVRELLRKQFLINNLLEQSALAGIEISDEEALTFYEANKEQFTRPEEVTVRHILLNQDNGTGEDLAQNTLDRIQSGEDFCDLVQELSIDLGSRDVCGEYTFSRGQMVETFEEASFSATVGEITTVKSDYGTHIIEKLGQTPAGHRPYEDVAETIKNALLVQAQREAYQDFIAELRENAEITYATTADEEAPEEMAPAEEDAEEIGQTGVPATVTIDTPTEPSEETTDEAPERKHRRTECFRTGCARGRGPSPKSRNVPERARRHALRNILELRNTEAARRTRRPCRSHHLHRMFRGRIQEAPQLNARPSTFRTRPSSSTENNTSDTGALRTSSRSPGATRTTPSVPTGKPGQQSRLRGSRPPTILFNFSFPTPFYHNQHPPCTTHSR